MTWNIADTLKHRTTPGQPGSADIFRPPAPGSAEVAWNDQNPLPTYVQGLEAYQGDGEERYPMDMERELAAEGWASAREMAAWRKLMSRGIASL